MTYAAEPYAQFVDDLLTALTGGAIREEFRFLPDREPFQLAAPAPVIPKTVRVYGLVEGIYARFRAGTDFELAQKGAQGTIVWNQVKNAVWPDSGSTFYVNYEHQGSNPSLTDRNTGSVTRLLAESFAREYAVLSRQLETVYQAGFLETATGRDLEQLAALVGVTRRRRLSAGGSVVFSRDTPAPADIFIPAGTKLTTVEPPPTVFETTESRTLQRGNLSVDVAVAAVVPGASGAVAANTIRIINRPILGVETLTNPQPARFSGADETDKQLRARCRRALETAGQATTGSLLGALTTLPGLREKDIRSAEDYLAHPGVVNLNIAFPEMSRDLLESTSAQAVALVEATRPVGVHIEYNFDAPRPLGPATPQNASDDEAADHDEPVTLGAPEPADGPFMPVNVKVVITPTTLSLSADERTKLATRAEETVADFLAGAGIGETLVYNRLVANLMELDGVLDVAVSMSPQGETGTATRRNVMPAKPTVKPVKGIIDVQIGGALILLSVSLSLEPIGAALDDLERTTAKSSARDDSAEKLQAFLASLNRGTLTADLLKGALSKATEYKVGDLHYSVEYVEEGVRVHQKDVPLLLTGRERLWLHRITLLDEAAS